MNMKKFALFGFLVLALAILSTGVFATPSFVNLDAVKVNGVVTSQFSPVLLERGQQVVVEVFFTGNAQGRCESGNDNPCYDTRVEVEIQGHENQEVRDVEGPFEVEPGVSYRKVLHFTLPIDMPASDNLNLNVEIKDDDELVSFNVPVRIQENRHSLNIFDVVLNPTNNVRAGQPLFATVRVENLGDNTESSVKVTVAIPELGVQTSEFVDRLASSQELEDEDVDDAATTNDLMLFIPSDADEGDYDVVVTLEYNRGFNVDEKRLSMHVKGQEQTPAVSGVQNTGVVVNVESETLRVEAGEGAVYRLSVANLGAQPATFTFDLENVENWASVRVDPSTLVVQPNDAKEVFVFVAPKEGVEGTKAFSVKTLSNGNVVSESQLMLDVVEPEGTTAKQVFTWIFVVLLALLVLLVIVVLVKKATSREKGVESQTYY